MKTLVPTKFQKRQLTNLELAKHHGKRLTGFMGKFLQFLMRKTEADRRIALFGRDPLKS
jgi:hypothetical protein